MLIEPTLTSEQFKTVHNALCNLDSVAHRLDGVLNTEMHAVMAKNIESIRSAFQSAYEAEDRLYEERRNHYDQWTSINGFKSVWSIYEVANLADTHPFAGADRVVYKDHWGKAPVSASIRGISWGMLWHAAEECINASGDGHHIFIEEFTVDPQDPRTLVLSTGS